MIRTVTTLAAAAALSAGTALADGLGTPTRIQAGDEPISVGTGHAAPFVHDFDKDGKKDLLVGQLGQGRLRIYRNVGTDTEPAFKDFEIFKVGESEATVPTG